MVGQGQKIDISHSGGGEKVRASEMGGIEQRNVVGAELVARVGAKSLQNLAYSADRAEMVGIGALAGDAHDAVLDQRAR